MTEQQIKEAAEKEFKVLTYCGMYVEASLLSTGIYNCHIPCIYSKQETIEGLIKKGREFKDFGGNCMIDETYFENLSKCSLSQFILSQSPTSEVSGGVRVKAIKLLLKEFKNPDNHGHQRSAVEFAEDVIESTHPVADGVKGAEEVLNSKELHSYYYPNGDSSKSEIHDSECKFCRYETDVIAAMEEYASQFKSDSSEGVSVEDENEIWLKVAKEFHFDKPFHESVVKDIISRIKAKGIKITSTT